MPESAVAQAGSEARLFDANPVAVAELLLVLRRKGVCEHSLLSALEQVPRRLFLPSERHQAAYRDRGQPIECGQFVTAPSTIALMTEALAVAPGHKVLQVGTGSGYQAAILAKLGARVLTLDRYSTLVELARQRFAALRLTSISAQVGDGLGGWRNGAPYNRILFSGALKSLPAEIVHQLAPGGLIVAPIGSSSGPQKLMRYERQCDDLDAREIGVGRFTELTPGVARFL